jgi:hypothetical protein
LGRLRPLVWKRVNWVLLRKNLLKRSHRYAGLTFKKKTRRLKRREFPTPFRTNQTLRLFYLLFQTSPNPQLRLLRD